MQDGITDLVTRKKYTEEKLKKKAFRSKLFEVCKTRTKKAIADMLNFYVVLAVLHKVATTGRVTTCRLNFKGPPLPTESTKTDGPHENMGFNGKTD